MRRVNGRGVFRVVIFLFLLNLTNAIQSFSDDSEWQNILDDTQGEPDIERHGGLPSNEDWEDSRDIFEELPPPAPQKRQEDKKVVSPPFPQQPTTNKQVGSPQSKISSVAAAGENNTKSIAKRILFNGTLTKGWEQYAFHGGNSKDHASFKAGGLYVSIPEKPGWSKVGLRSTKAMFWLDDFGDYSEYDLTYSFDPQQTNSIALGLSTYRIFPQSPPSPSNAIFLWRKTPAAEKASCDLVINNKSVWTKEVGPDPPESVTISMTPGEVIISINSRPLVAYPWAELTAFSGFTVFAYSQPVKKDLAAKMALKSISLSANQGTSLGLLPFLSNTSPFSEKNLFTGEPGELWETIGVAGGNFKKFGRFEKGRMIIKVPGKNSWGKTGLLSKEPLLKLDRFTLGRTPHLVRLKVDPKQTSGFVLAFSTSKKPDMWQDHILWLHVAKKSFSYHRNGNATEAREKPVDWTGEVKLFIGNGWFVAQPEGAKPMRANADFAPGGNYYLTIVSHPPKEHAPSALVLESLSIGMAATEDMTQLQFWEMSETETFDGDKYLNELQNEYGRMIAAPKTSKKEVDNE